MASHIAPSFRRRLIMKVLKPFTSTLRRFPEGATVSVDDDVSPHTLESLSKAGFIEPLFGKQKDKPETDGVEDKPKRTK